MNCQHCCVRAGTRHIPSGILPVIAFMMCLLVHADAATVVLSATNTLSDAACAYAADDVEIPSAIGVNHFTNCQFGSLTFTGSIAGDMTFTMRGGSISGVFNVQQHVSTHQVAFTFSGVSAQNIVFFSSATPQRMQLVTLRIEGSTFNLLEFWCYNQLFSQNVISVTNSSADCSQDCIHLHRSSGWSSNSFTVQNVTLKAQRFGFFTEWIGFSSSNISFTNVTFDTISTASSHTSFITSSETVWRYSNVRFRSSTATSYISLSRWVSGNHEGALVFEDCNFESNAALDQVISTSTSWLKSVNIVRTVQMNSKYFIKYSAGWTPTDFVAHVNDSHLEGGLSITDGQAVSTVYGDWQIHRSTIKGTVFNLCCLTFTPKVTILYSTIGRLADGWKTSMNGGTYYIAHSELTGSSTFYANSAVARAVFLSQNITCVNVTMKTMLIDMGFIDVRALHISISESVVDLKGSAQLGLIRMVSSSLTSIRGAITISSSTLKITSEAYVPAASAGIISDLSTANVESYDVTLVSCTVDLFGSPVGSYASIVDNYNKPDNLNLVAKSSYFKVTGFDGAQLAPVGDQTNFDITDCIFVL